MSNSELEDGIIQKIVKSCKETGFIVSREMASFFARSIILNQKLGFTDLTQNSGEKISDLISLSIERLCQKDSPRLETIKMQVSVVTAEKDFEKELASKKKSRHFKSRRIARDIITKENEVEVFGDMVIYILHKIKLLELSNEEIEQETMKALESVIPRDFVNSFMKQGESEKRMQLHELWKIVWGIKMFNNCSPSHKNCERERQKLNIFKGTQIKKLMEELKTEMRELSEKVQKILEYMLMTSREEVNSRLRIELVNRRQYVHFLKYFHRLLENSFTSVELLKNKFLSELEGVHDIVTTYSSVEKSKIYPKFMKLAQNWKESNGLFENVKRVQYLFHFLRTYKHSYNERIDQLQRKVFRAPPKKEIETNIDDSFYEKTEDLLQPYRIKYNDELLLRTTLSGNHFDVVSITDGKRILYEASPEVDCVSYGGRIYGFAKEEFLQKFFKDPQEYIHRLEAFIEFEPELIYLLGFEEELLPKSIISEELQEIREKKSFEMQTEVHPIETHIDRTYEWSEWKLRKRALKIADLRNKRTHSTQTDKSHFKRDNNSQVFLKKSITTQTTKEKGTNPVKHVRYIKNLRGVKGGKVKVVEMTFDQQD